MANRKSLLQQIVETDGRQGLNEKYVDYALSEENGGGFGADYGGIRYEKEKNKDGSRTGYLTHDYSNVSQTLQEKQKAYADRVRATTAQNSWASRNETVKTNPERDSLLEEYKRLANTTTNSIPVVQRRNEIRKRLDELDVELGNGIRDYTVSDKTQSVIGGAVKDYGGGLFNYIGGRLSAMGETSAPVNPSLLRAQGMSNAEISQAMEQAAAANPNRGERLRSAGASVEEIAASISDDAQQDLTRAKNGLSKLGQAGVDIATNMIQMGFDVAVGALTGGNALIPMYARSAGSSYAKAKGEGASTAAATLYSMASGGIEVFTEKMADGLAGIYGAGAADVFTERMIRKLTKSDLGRSFLRLVIGAGEEGIEEVVSDLLQPYAETIYNGNSPLSVFQNTFKGTYDPSDLLYDFIIGAAVGMVGGGIGAATGSNARPNQIARYADQAESALREQGVASRQATRVGEIIANQAMGEDLTRREQRLFDRTEGAQEIAQGIQNQEKSYVRSILETEKQQRAAQAKENAQQQRVAKYMERVRAGEVDETRTADTKNATVEYQGRQAKIDFVRDGNENRIRLKFDDGSEKTVSYQEAEEAGLDENVKNLIVALSAIGPNAPAAYSVYDSSQEVGKYAAAMDEAINLYAAQGQDVRQAAKAAKEAGSTALITYLNDAQLEMAQSLGAKIYEQKQTQVKEAGTKLKQIRQQAQEAMSSQDKTAAEGLAAVNTTLAETREHYKTIRAAYDQTVEYLEEMDANGQQETEAYQNALEQANYLRSDLEGTQRVISSLEAERKNLQAKQPIKRKKGTVSFDGATDGKTTFEGVDPSKLNKKQSAVVDMVKSLADVLDIDFVFFQGPAGTGGFYRGGNTIYININSGMGVGDFNNVIAAGSLSHELTHWLQEYAPEEYEALRQFIVNDIIEKRGADAFERLVQQQMNWEKGRQLSRDAAIDEVVANACQTMLRDSSAITELAQQNKSLAEKIRDFIKDLIDRIKAAFEDVDISNKAAIYDAARAIQGEYEDILKLWDDALRAAAETGSTVRAMETEKQEEMPAAAQRVGPQYMAWDNYSEREIENWKNSKNIVIFQNDNQLMQFIQDARDGKLAGKKMYFGKVSEALASRIRQETGVETKNYNITLSAYEIQKIFKDHGTAETEETRGQRPITEQDFADIPLVISEADTIERSERDYNGKPVIIFRKNIDGKRTVTAYVSDKRVDLHVQTMYAGAKKQSLATPIDEQASINTPEANSGTALTDNISEAAAPVKQETTPGKATLYQEWDTQHNNWAPEFYSKMDQTITDWTNGKGQKLPEKMAASQVVGWLKGKGVKDEEIKWSGIVPYLQGKKTVTQAELQAVMAGNEIRIQTKTLEDRKLPEFIAEIPSIGDYLEFANYNEAYDYARRLATRKGLDPDQIRFEDGKFFVFDPEAFDVQVVLEVQQPDVWDEETGEKIGNRTHWKHYTLPGGQNYREIMFQIPGMKYENRASRLHWRDDAPGTIAHARIQDMTDEHGVPVLFVEEIQSDLHNAGASSGFTSEDQIAQYNKLMREARDKNRRKPTLVNSIYYALGELVLNNPDVFGDSFVTQASIESWIDGSSTSPSDSFDEDYNTPEMQKKQSDLAYSILTDEQKKQVEEIRKASKTLKEFTAKNEGIDFYDAAPDVPFAGSADTYHEYIMKHILRMAAEGGYGAVGWTTAQQQVDRWSDEYAEGYRIEYDQNIPKFMRKYGKQWGATVEGINLENGQEVWGMYVDQDMANSVLEKGQPRFQMWDTVEETDKLVAVHNKSVSGLRRMLDRNGVPFPSIAIKKAGTSHEGFGDVSIVFPRSTIDPEVNRQNRLYSNDAWTPTEPIIEYDVGDTWRYQKKLRKILGDDIYTGLHTSSYLEESDLARKLQSYRGDIFETLNGQSALRYAYLKSIGQEPDVGTTENQLPGRYKNKQYLAIFSEISEDEIENARYENEELRQKIADILEKQFESQFDEEKRAKIQKHPIYTADKINVYDIQHAFHNYKNDGYQIKTVPDYDALDRYLKYDRNDLATDEGYKAWILDQFKDLIVDQGIPNGKDYYTPSGNPRSFKSRHIPATMENIVAQMLKEQERGNGVMGINLRGAATKSYRNVEEMRAESGKLLGKHIADDVYDSYMSGFHQRLHDMSRDVILGEYSWEGQDSAEEILLTVLRDARSKQNMDTLLQREARWIKYSPELTEKLWQLREDVQNMPAPYFEAKPRRVVYPGEALAYILPDNADQDVVDRLNDLGYRVLTYKAGDEADRLDKLNSIQEARFQQWGNQDQMSMWDGPNQISLDEWMAGEERQDTSIHPRIRKLLDDAAATEQRVREFFSQIPEDSEYYLDPDEIDDMMEVDPFGSAYDGYMYGAEQLIMNLSDLSKGMQGAAKEQAYELMDELLGYLSTSQAANWKEDRLTENKTFTEWYNRKHPSMYYPGYVPGKFLKYEEKRYLQNGIRNGIFTGEDLAEAQRKLAAIDDPASGTWYQKWDDFDPDDFATETQERKESYTRIQAEDVTLAEAIAGLNAAIAKQKTTIGKIQERLKLGRTQETRESDAMKLAKHLLAKHGSTADPNRVAAELKALGDYLLQTKKVDQDELKQRARVVAADIIENAEQEAEPTGEEQIYREIADNIKGKKLTIDSKDLGELDEVGGYDAFRRANFGRFTLAKRTKNGEVKEGYETVESAYRAMQATYGTAYFPDMQGKTEGDLIQTMASFFDLAEPEIVNPYESFKGEAIEETANSIVADALDGILRPVSTEATTKQQAKELGKQIEAGEQGAVNLIAAAQKIAEAYETADSRVEALKLSIELLKKQEGKANEKELEALRETVYDLTIALDKAESHYRTLQKSAEARMAQIRAEGRARQTEIRAEAKAKANAAAAKHYKEMAKRARERRKENAGAAKYRAKIQQQAKKLSDWLMKNSDKEHIPEAIKAPLISFLSSLDFTSKRALNGGAQTQNDMKFGARLQKLQQMLANQQSYLNGDGTVQEDLGGYIDIGQDMLQFLRDMAQKATDEMSTGNYYTINRMSATELKDLSNLLASLTTSIRNMNNLMANARYETVRQAASQDIEEMERLGQAADRESKGIWKFLKWKDATPYYAMKRLGRGAQSIFDGLTRGWEKLAFHAQEIIDFTEKTYTDKEVNEWKKDIHNIELSDGSRIRMTTAQIMELAMLYNRDQAQKHLRAGGMRIGNIEYKKGTITDTKHYHLTAEDINKLFDMLTSRQLEVAYKLQKFMANKGAEWGNEISMRRFGYNFYTEGENYYPIRTDSNDRAMRDTDAQENSMFRLLNLSSSKSLNPKASNALVVGDIFDTFADHMADQAKLNALGLPILDGIKWFNFKERIDLEDGTYDTRTLQAAMEQAFGSEAQHYFRTLMKDINGVTESGDRGTNLASRMMSNYKIASVGANLRVAMLQPTAYVRAQTVISPRNLLRAFAYKNGYKEAMKYSGTAVWKSMGYYDTNISRNMRQQIQHNETARDKIVEASMKLAEHGDQVTWGRIWVACKLQAQEMNPELAGDALIQETANLFRQVVYSSQVMDSTLTRSELMRSHSFWDKNLTAFMAEPTLSYNILLDAYSEYEKDVRERGKQGAWQRNSDKILKAITVYESSAIVAAIAESIADAIRDDDDDESALDKFLQAFLGEDSFLDGNLFQDVLLTGKIPYAKNIWSLLQGYDNSDMVFGGISNLIKVFEIWKETVQLATGDLDKATKTTYYGNMTAWGKVYKTLQSLSQVSGFPVSGMMRDVFAIWNATAGSIVPYWKIKTYDKNHLSQGQKNAWTENLKGLGITQGQYQRMRTEMDADGNGSLKQDEVGAYLDEQVKFGNLTKEQAEAIWASAGTTWKKTYSQWRGDPEPAAASPKTAAAATPAITQEKITTYDQFKKAAHIFSDNKEEAYNLWESTVKPLGIDLDRYTQYINASDTDENGSVKQDELGKTLTTEIYRKQLSLEQARAIWKTLWNGPRSKTYDKWASSKGF